MSCQNKTQSLARTLKSWTTCCIDKKLTLADTCTGFYIAYQATPLTAQPLIHGQQGRPLNESAPFHLADQRASQEHRSLLTAANYSIIGRSRINEGRSGGHREAVLEGSPEGVQALTGRSLQHRSVRSGDSSLSTPQAGVPALNSSPPPVHGSHLASYAFSAQLPHAVGAQSVTTPVICAASAFLAIIPSTDRMLPCVMHVILRATFLTQPTHSPQRCLFMVTPCNVRSPSDGEGVCLPGKDPF